MAEKGETTVTIMEVSVGKQGTGHITLNLDEKRIKIPVSKEVETYFKEQFVRPNPTPHQRKRFTTVMNLLRAAYQKGRADGK